jgi:hypothetical protein
VLNLRRGGQDASFSPALSMDIQAMRQGIFQALKGIAEEAGREAYDDKTLFLVSHPASDLQGAHEAILAGFRHTHGLLTRTEMDAVSQAIPSAVPDHQNGSWRSVVVLRAVNADFGCIVLLTLWATGGACDRANGAQGDA